MPDLIDIEFLALLTKSSDYMLREAARTALAEPDLAKVGPKGYIHGWIHVGAGVGDDVFHPRHGRGMVTRVDEHGHAHVRFESGKTRSFEHASASGDGRLTARSEAGNDAFTTHLQAAASANRRKDHAAAADHYRQAATAAKHPKIRDEMLARADRDAAKAPVNLTTTAGSRTTPRVSTAEENAVADAAGAAHNTAQVARFHDHEQAAAELEGLRDRLRSGKTPASEAANEFEAIAARHAQRHGGGDYTHRQITDRASDLRGSEHYGQLMAESMSPHATEIARYRANNDRKIRESIRARDAAQHPAYRDLHQQRIDTLTERNRVAEQTIAARHPVVAPGPDLPTHRPKPTFASIAAGLGTTPNAIHRDRAARRAQGTKPRSAEADRHVAAADEALRAGDRSAAISHLTAAANRKTGSDR